MSPQSNSESTSSVPGVSGKKLTYITLGMLTVVVGSLIYLLAIYDSLDAARAKSAEQWRACASELDQDYRKVESLTAEQSGLTDQWLKQFQSDADQFRTATNIETQVSFAVKLEEALKQNAASLATNLPVSSETLRLNIKNFNQCVSEEAAILGSRSGRALHIILPVPERQPLELAR